MQHHMPVTPRFAVPLDENGLVDWLLDAEPGDSVVYYRGHLGHDRMPSAHVLDRQSRIDLHAVASRVMVLSAQELVLPVQKRVGPEDCLYIAVKARPRRPGAGCHEAPLTSSRNFTEPTTLALAA